VISRFTLNTLIYLTRLLGKRGVTPTATISQLSTSHENVPSTTAETQRTFWRRFCNSQRPLSFTLLRTKHEGQKHMGCFYLGYHSCLQITKMYLPQQLKRKERSEEGSATHKGLFLLHSCTPSMKDKSTWAVSS